MNRRFFLASLGALAFDPERLLWLPGRKFISIPKPVPEIWLYETEFNRKVARAIAIPEWSYYTSHPRPGGVRL